MKNYSKLNKIVTYGVSSVVVIAAIIIIAFVVIYYMHK
jgi:hypothetical protein